MLPCFYSKFSKQYLLQAPGNPFFLLIVTSHSISASLSSIFSGGKETAGMSHNRHHNDISTINPVKIIAICPFNQNQLLLCACQGDNGITEVVSLMGTISDYFNKNLQKKQDLERKKWPPRVGIEGRAKCDRRAKSSPRNAIRLVL